ncbi:MAG: S1 RNA-binding domain-containing protein [Defluviitaleaceae bacterium]|nr:S1 RNA-binding domain-containing protein [Defluviitaleaceae bacterium]
MPRKKEAPSAEIATVLDNPQGIESASGAVADFASPDRRQSTQAETPAPILTLEAGTEIETQKEKENAIWHEIKTSQVTGSHLSGILGKVELLANGGLIAVVDYKAQRVVIPINEMMLDVNRPEAQSDEEYNERLARVLNRMIGTEIDFVVRGISTNGGERAAVASRKAAMLRLRRRYYFTNGANGKPQIYPERIVEARIAAVSQLAIRVEIFGVEATIRNRELSWGYVSDCRDKYFVGDSVHVRIREILGETPESLRVKADIRSLTEDYTQEKLLALKPQTNCIGKIIDIRGGVIFISLVDGVRAIAHKCFDQRKPGRGDDVLFVCTRIDEDGGVAVGIISRIIRRNI